MITVEELEKIAALAKLSLDGEDIEALRRDISSVLEFADTIAQVVIELPAVSEADGSAGTPGEDVIEAVSAFREDVVRASYPVEEILSNAGEQQDGFYVARQRGGLIR